MVEGSMLMNRVRILKKNMKQNIFERERERSQKKKMKERERGKTEWGV